MLISSSFSRSLVCEIPSCSINKASICPFSFINSDNLSAYSFSKSFSPFAKSAFNSSICFSFSSTFSFSSETSSSFKITICLDSSFCFSMVLTVSSFSVNKTSSLDFSSVNSDNLSAYSFSKSFSPFAKSAFNSSICFSFSSTFSFSSETSSSFKITICLDSSFCFSMVLTVSSFSANNTSSLDFSSVNSDNLSAYSFSKSFASLGELAFNSLICFSFSCIFSFNSETSSSLLPSSIFFSSTSFFA